MNAIHTVPNDSVEQILSVFNAQQQNLQNIKNQSVSERKKLLKKLLSVILTHRPDIQRALQLDFRKPATEVDMVEIFPVVSELKNILSHINRWAKAEKVKTPLSLLGSSSKVIREPKGQCLIITPWNYPFQLAISPILYAVASGNAVILKASEFAPNIFNVIKSILSETFPENQVALVGGDHTVSQALLDLKFDHIHFTGSPSVGKLVMASAAKHLTSVTLELGGKSPVIVDETADLKVAASKIVWGKYLNAGQTCIAPDYVLVHHSILPSLVEQMKKEIAKKYGTDFDHRIKDNNLCSIVNAKHYQRVKTLLEQAKSNGATVHTGGHYDDTIHYIDPTIIGNIDPNDGLLNEEIFGPIMPLVGYTSWDEAFKFIQNKEKPLALYIFSTSQKNIDHILKNTTAGGTAINDTMIHIANPNLPFGGVNHSGIGKSHGVWGFLDFCNERAVLTQNQILPAATHLFHPPYGNKLTQTLANLAIKYL